eukprot:gene12904-14234_t
MSKTILFKGQRIESVQDLMSKWSLKCSQCSKLFSSKFCLNRHLQIHLDQVKPRKFECSTCKKRFHEIANYLRHCMFHDRNKASSKGQANGGPEDVEVHEIQLLEQSQLSDAPVDEENGFVEHSNTDDQSEAPNNTDKYERVADTRESGIFYCGHCPESYDNTAALSSHVAQQHKQGFKCRLCRHVSQTIEDFLQHRSNHDKKLYKCQFCPRTFAIKKSCTIHERVHTGEKPHQCTTCQRAFTQKSHLADHMRTHTGARPFACNQCSLAFTTHSSRRRHQRVVHKVGEKVYTCELCGAVMTSKYSISRHLKRHETGVVKNEEKKFLCSICNHYFASSSSLRKHLQRMHNNEGGNTMCTLCNMSYYSESTLQQHLSRVHAIAPASETVDSISCDECGALMQTKAGILIHKRRCHSKSSAT